jgi:hypothetical protein
MQLLLFFVFFLEPKVSAPFASLFFCLKLHQEIVLGWHFMYELIKASKVLQAPLFLDDLLLMSALLGILMGTTCASVSSKAFLARHILWTLSFDRLFIVSGTYSCLDSTSLMLFDHFVNIGSFNWWSSIIIILALEFGLVQMTQVLRGHLTWESLTGDSSLVHDLLLII